MKTNTKYIKVSVSEGLPEESKYYETNIGRLFYNRVMKEFENEVFNPMKVDYWLQEVPDYEDDMKEMLEEVLNESDEYNYVSSDLYFKIEELLTKLKTES